MKNFEIIAHPADVGFIAHGATLAELFENAALAMFSLACDASTVEERLDREVSASGDSLESLLFCWLADLLAISDAEHIFFRCANVTELSETRVRGKALGEPYDKTRHSAGTYIKAVTYHQLCVEKTADGWRARVFLDV